MRSASRLVVALGICAWLVQAPYALAQSPGFPPEDRTQPVQSGQADGEKITFEVASVRQNKSNDGIQGARMLPGGRITVTRLSLGVLIRMASGYKFTALAPLPSAGTRL